MVRVVAVFELNPSTIATSVGRPIESTRSSWGKVCRQYPRVVILYVDEVCRQCGDLIFLCGKVQLVLEKQERCLKRQEVVGSVDELVGSIFSLCRGLWTPVSLGKNGCSHLT